MSAGIQLPLVPKPGPSVGHSDSPGVLNPLHKSYSARPESGLSQALPVPDSQPVPDYPLDGAGLRTAGHGCAQHSTTFNPFADKDRDKSYIGQFSEVIEQVRMTTSDGSTVIMDLENLGQIEVIPWSSEHEPGDMFGTAEDRTVFNPVNGHDVMVLQLMAEHAKRFYATAIEQHEAKMAGEPGEIFPPVEQIRKDMRSAR